MTLFKLAILIMVPISSWAGILSNKVLVANEAGGVVQLCAKTGEVLQTYNTGANSFGALYSKDSKRAFTTDKNAGTLVEISTIDNKIVQSLVIGTTPQQPAMTSSNLIFIPLSGEASVAIVDANASFTLLGKVSVGAGSKPHIVALSPDEKTLWVTVQGTDPRVIAYSVEATNLKLLKEFRYDIVPRVVDAYNNGAYFTGHHSTGIHHADLANGLATTTFVDENGAGSEPRKQIEGVSVLENYKLVALTHEGRNLVRVLDFDGKLKCSVKLPAKPYWVTLDSSGETAFVSMPDAAIVSAYDIGSCSQKSLWTANTSGKAKRLAVAE